LNQSPEAPIPEDIRRFIVKHIDSVEALEILLLLFGNAGEELSPEEASRRLYTSVESAARRLDQLQRVKLLVSISTEPPKYRFNSASPDATLMGELEKVYKERRVSIISFIYSKPTDPLRAFSDAFRLRKEES